MDPFPRNPTCTDCDLHALSENPCIPTRAWRPLNRDTLTPLIEPGAPKSQALLIIGEAPGVNEDLKGESFIGQAGGYLDRLYIQAFRLPELADVYLTNAVRCHPPENRTPGKGQMNACRAYLAADLEILTARYDSVTILCTGAAACRSLLDCSLTEALRRQGTRIDFRRWQDIEQRKNIRAWIAVHFPDDECLKEPRPRLEDSPGGIPCFSTYHPAILLPRRDPSKIVYVKRHLEMLCRFLKSGDALPSARPPPTINLCPDLPSELTRLSIDIETYGIISWMPEQTVFHPRKSEVIDGIRPEDMIQCVAVAWREDGALQTGSFIWSNPFHRGRLLEFVHVAEELLLMNALFDVQYKRYCGGPAWQGILQRSKTVLVDLAVTNYLAAGARPERSLKNLGPLYGVAKYGDFQRYPSADDPELLAYNALDARTTLELQEKMEEEIARDFPDTPKLSAFTRKWYSDLLWVLIEMSEAGISMSRPRLETLRTQLVRRMDRVATVYEARFGDPIAGTGSQKGLKEFVDDAIIQLGLEDHPSLQITPQRRAFSTGKVNLSLILREGAPGSPIRKQCKLITRYRKAQKVTSTYVDPLLGRVPNRLSSSLLGGIAYPQWYPVPSAFKDDSAEEGGTSQARLSCKQPAAQTFPPAVTRCLDTRFDPGIRIRFDYNQLELRVAALLSGDPVMLQEYLPGPGLPFGIDRHRQAALAMFGEKIIGRPDFDVYRQAGKKRNFLILYLGGAEAYQKAILNELGLDIPLQDCRAAIQADHLRYAAFTKWQNDLIETAKREGYIYIPLIGQSRSFLGSRKAVQDTYVNEIVNIKIQGVAACILESAHIGLSEAFRLAKLRACITLSIHDALDIELPENELAIVQKLANSCFTMPLYLRKLQEELGRTEPDFPVEEKIIARRP